MTDEIKKKIGLFCAGVGTAVVAFIAFILGRKQAVSDGNGIRPDNQQLNDSTERVSGIEERVSNASDSIDNALSILRNAKDRAEKE